METGSSHGDAMARTQPATACVVLTAPGDGVGEQLRSRLEDRAWRPIAVDDPYLAMAELCLRDHARRSRTALGRDEGEPPVLVLAGPTAGGGIGRMRDMFKAIRRYLPDASIWLFANEELLPLHGAKIDPAGTGDEPPARSGPPPAGRPEAISAARRAPRPLRLTEPLTAPTPPPDHDQAGEDETGDDESGRITAEEIEMLLQRRPQPEEQSGP
jgi:hypothetical protein